MQSPFWQHDECRLTVRRQGTKAWTSPSSGPTPHNSNAAMMTIVSFLRLFFLSFLPCVSTGGLYRYVQCSVAFAVLAKDQTMILWLLHLPTGKQVFYEMLCCLDGNANWNSVLMGRRVNGNPQTTIQVNARKGKNVKNLSMRHFRDSVWMQYRQITARRSADTKAIGQSK